MITCQHARHLFDSYLDGELSASLQTELHAHRLQCTACQNELALLEACGDVVAMDRREPEVGGDFTSRVLLAYRGRPAAKRRRWGRVAWWIGSPVAAAASIALVMSLVVPRNEPVAVNRGPTAIAGAKEAIPEAAQGALLHRELTEAERRDLNKTPQMSENAFADTVRASYERFVNTGEGLRQSGAVLVQLVGGLSNTNEKLAARWQDQQKAKTPAAGSPEQVDGGVDPTDPSYLSQPPAVPDAGTPAEEDAPGEVV